MTQDPKVTMDPQVPPDLRESVGTQERMVVMDCQESGDPLDPLVPMEKM